MRMLHGGPDLGRTPGSTTPRSRSARAGVLVRLACRLLVLAAVTIASVQLFAVHFHDPVMHGHAQAEEPGWLIPILALVAAMLALLIAVVPIVGPVLGSRDVALRLRAGLNGLLWGVIVMLAVQFTGDAFAVVPGGHELVGLVLGSTMAVVTSHTHRRRAHRTTPRHCSRTRRAARWRRRSARSRPP